MCGIGRTLTTRLTLLLGVSLAQAVAQEPSQAQPALFLRANDSFAFDLLETAHKEFPDRNIVIAPLPISLTFAALCDGTPDIDSAKELQAAFHWDQVLGLPAGARMVLTRFEKPKPRPAPHTAFQKRMSSLLQMPPGKPEELWLSTAFLYRGAGSLSPDFIDRISYDFGIPFRAVGEHSPQPEILAKNWDPSLPMPKIAHRSDFWITSFTHLRTSWAGNTFVGAKREKHKFQLRSGDVVQADFLRTESEFYPYARTEEFEAVVLTCKEATILFVLPSASGSVEQLEAAFAERPNLVDPLLKRSEGDVRLPPFHFSFEANLRNSIEAMGARRIFTDPIALYSIAPNKPGAVLRGVAQKAEITVDENGMRAESGTVVSGVYGGIMAAQAPFHMTLDRPFLFFIRDRVTRALLFEGALMNPTLQ
jgi:serine protease inhibitor